MKVNTEPDFNGLKRLLAEPELFDPLSMPVGLDYLRSHDKRLVDLKIALGMLPFCIPVGLLAATAIPLVDHVSPIFRQERIGVDGDPFTIFKFQTMPGMPGDTHSSGRHDDERRSALGKKLSLFRIDEILNLINIAKGEMSFGGPRPLLESYILHARYLLGPKVADSWVRDRSLALPSLVDNFTIWHHSHGADFPDMDEKDRLLKRVEMEDEYIFQKASPEEDFRLVREAMAMLGRAAARRSHIGFIEKKFGHDAP